MTIVLIMLLHALPVFLIGILSQSRGLLLLAALISAGIGILSGNPRYAGLDLIAVVAAYWLTVGLIPEPTSTPNPYLPPEDDLD